MDHLRVAISIKAADDRLWGPRDAEGRRRYYTAEEMVARMLGGSHRGATFVADGADRR